MKKAGTRSLTSFTLFLFSTLLLVSCGSETSQPKKTQTAGSVAEAFPNPNDVLEARDTQATLVKLRAVASPTEKYHQDLLDLAISAKHLDLAHLKLLADACYYPYSQYHANEAQEQAKAWSLASYVNRILLAGIPKLDALDFDGAKQLLSRLYPHHGAEPVVEKVLARVGHLSGPQKQEALVLARKKAAHAAAAELAYQWFTEDSDHAASTLVKVASEVQESRRDDLLLKGLESVAEVDRDDVLLFARTAPAKKGEVAAAAFGKSRNPSVSGAAAIAEQLSGKARAHFLLAAVDQVKDLSVENLETLAALGQESADDIRARGMERLTNSGISDGGGGIPPMPKP